MRTTIVKWMKIVKYCSLIIYFFNCAKDGPENGGGGSGGSGSYTISNVAFGENADPNGDIQNPDSVFLSDETEVYYLIEFGSPFPWRSKVRKTWEIKNGTQWNTLFSAIQIVEEGDQRIFGVFRKKDNTQPVGLGDYRIKIQYWKIDNYIDIDTTPKFKIQSIQ